MFSGSCSNQYCFHSGSEDDHTSQSKAANSATVSPVLLRSASSDSLEAWRRAIGWINRLGARNDGRKALMADILILLMRFMVCKVKDQHLVWSELLGIPVEMQVPADNRQQLIPVIRKHDDTYYI